jgi:hypothetical protein
MAQRDGVSAKTSAGGQLQPFANGCSLAFKDGFPGIYSLGSSDLQVTPICAPASGHFFVISPIAIFPSELDGSDACGA